MSLEEQFAAEADRFAVVVNHEEQYSIWPAPKPLPAGWSEAGKIATKAECLDYIKEVWTDMRPLSLRQQMAEAARQQVSSSITSTHFEPKRSDLVERLSAGVFTVKACVTPETAEDFNRMLNSGYLYLQFTHPGGETRLRVKLDTSRCDLSEADFKSGVGNAHLEGELTLNFVKVRCIADIGIDTRTGEGRLEVLGA